MISGHVLVRVLEPPVFFLCLSLFYMLLFFLCHLPVLKLLISRKVWLHLLHWLYLVEARVHFVLEELELFLGLLILLHLLVLHQTVLVVGQETAALFLSSLLKLLFNFFRRLRSWRLKLWFRRWLSRLQTQWHLKDLFVFFVFDRELFLG